MNKATDSSLTAVAIVILVYLFAPHYAQLGDVTWLADYLVKPLLDAKARGIALSGMMVSMMCTIAGHLYFPTYLGRVYLIAITIALGTYAIGHWMVS